MSATMSGHNKLKSQLSKYEAKLGAAIETGLMKAGYYLLVCANALVPLETTALRESGHVRQEGNSFHTAAVVGYGTYGFIHAGINKQGQPEIRSPETYAVFVHEDTQAHHDAGQQAKFLETPARTEKDTLAKIVQGECKKVKI